MGSLFLLPFFLLFCGFLLFHGIIQKKRGAFCFSFRGFNIFSHCVSTGGSIGRCVFIDRCWLDVLRSSAESRVYI